MAWLGGHELAGKLSQMRHTGGAFCRKTAIYRFPLSWPSQWGEGARSHEVETSVRWAHAASDAFTHVPECVPAVGSRWSLWSRS